MKFNNYILIGVVVLTVNINAYAISPRMEEDLNRYSVQAEELISLNEVGEEYAKIFLKKMGACIGAGAVTATAFITQTFFFSSLVGDSAAMRSDGAVGKIYDKYLEDFGIEGQGANGAVLGGVLGGLTDLFIFGPLFKNRKLSNGDERHFWAGFLRAYASFKSYQTNHFNEDDPQSDGLCIKRDEQLKILRKHIVENLL